MRHVSSLLALSCFLSAVVACSGSGDSGEGAGGSGAEAGSSAGGSAGKSAGGSAGSSAGGSAGTSGAAGGSAGGKAGSAGTTAGGAAGAAGGSVGGAAGAAGGTAGAAGSAAGGTAGSSAGGTSAGASGQGGASAGASGSGAGGTSVDHGPLVGLAISPSIATIEVVQNVSAPQPFQALPLYQDGTTGEPASGVTWSIDQADLATVSAGGVATATGNRAGDGVITAVWQTFTATADLKIKIKLTSGLETIPPEAQGPLDGATTPDPGGARLSYPYDQTVFPRGLLPPEFMWTNVGAGEPMKLTLTSELVSLESYFVAPPESRYALTQEQWSIVTEAGKGGPVTVKLARLSGGAATVVANQTWRIASGSLRGTVYYWSNNKGKLLRIKPGATAPEDFLTAAGNGPGGSVEGCSTCHAVSANGSTLIIGGDVAASTFDLVNGVSTFSTTSIGKPQRNWAMPAVSPSGKFLVENNDYNIPGPPGSANGGGFWNTATGEHITTNGLDAGALLDMPAFSPDSSRIVYIDHTTKSLNSIGYSEAGGVPQAFGALKLVDFSPLPAESGLSGTVFAFPTVSPDGKQTVYARSALDTRFGPGDLYLAGTEAPGPETALAALNGTNYDFVAGDRDRRYNYEPTFMPVAAGGYYWVVFTSRRTYGNRLTSPNKDAVKQLWVAAIDQNAQPGKDPSHPPIWVPGQDLGDLNMRAFWALDPCRENGASCEAASQCCGKVCLENGTCGGGQSAGCQQVGETCQVADDCCGAADGFQCINNHCTEPKP